MKPAFGVAPELPQEHGRGHVPAAKPKPDLPNLRPTDTTSSGKQGPQKQPIVDWASAFWGSLGVPPALITQLNKAMAGYTDSSIALSVGQNLLRQSDWFAHNFPGFDLGVQHGLFTDERGYRDYVNQLNTASQQFQGRAITAGEVHNYLAAGVNPSNVGNILQGNALAQVQAPQLQQEAGAFGTGRLSQKELQAYGQQESGFSNALGLRVQQMLKQAQQRMQGVFNSPNLATPVLTARELNAGVQALAGGRSPTRDVGAL